MDTIFPTSTSMWTLADTAGGGSSHARFWLGKSLGASEHAAHTEWLFMFIMWVTIISFVFLMAVMFYLAWKYRRSAQASNYQVSSAHNTPLELAWSIIPFIIMVPIFYWGMRGYVEKLASPPDAEDIAVTGQKWNWSFKYANGAEPQETAKITQTGIESPVFVVPAGRPIKLSMTSKDVLHAFYIPDFRLKMDVIPNRITSMWFEPKAPGEHTVFCAEYCGDSHSEMHAKLRVVTPEQYKTTLAEWLVIVKPERTPKEIGTLLYNVKGCATCHSLDGSKGTGPSWKGAYGITHNFTDGSTGVVNDDYLREAILYSQKKIVVGYPPSMPVYAGQLTDDEVYYLTMFIKSLGDSASAEDKAKMDVKLQDQPGLPGSGAKK